jgi:hypothetical protein
LVAMKAQRLRYGLEAWRVVGSFIDGSSRFLLAQSARTNPVPVSLTKDTGSCIVESKRPRSEAEQCRS